MAAMWQQLHGVMGLWLLLAVGLALLSGVLRSARFKGWLGERLVRRWLAQGLDPQHYHALHDLTLRLHDGSTTQIDHVVVSVHGVFVLESKHLQGWIFGAERQQNWTQTFYRHRVRFQNPLRQNWRHLKALETLLDVPLAHLHSVVVLTGTAQFKTAMPAQVVQGAAVVPYVRSFNAQLLAPEAVQRILQQLDAQRLAPTRATHRAHVAHLRQRHARAEGASPASTPGPATVPATATATAPEVALRSSRPLADAVEATIPGRTEPVLHPEPPPTTPQAAAPCPRCAAPLVARSVSRDDGAWLHFWRCQRFPECRHMQPRTAQVLPLEE
jgi:hypothetical protein